MTGDSLNRGRQAYRRRAWGEAYRELSAADQEGNLEAEDLQRLFTAAFLTGRGEEFREVAARAFRSFQVAGNIAGAARCAFSLVMHYAEHRNIAQSGGWLGRFRTLLEESGVDCVEQGYLMIPTALHSLRAGDAAGALSAFTQIAKIARRFHDIDLLTLSTVGRGNALVALGETAEGIASIDEAMVTVTAGELSPILCGFMYCAGIEFCRRIFDMGRLKEWTAGLARWCVAEPDVVAFRGECLASKVEVMRLHGSWHEASHEAQQACRLLEGPPPEPAASLAYYQQAELHRLSGKLEQAEETYRLVSRFGGSPQPGLALLRLSQGDVERATSSIRLAADEASSFADRASILGPYVEILLAAGEVTEAQKGAAELTQLARQLDSRLLAARAAYAAGSVLMAAGSLRPALERLREAWAVYRDLDVPYEGARTRTLIGLACRQLGDEDTARMELDAAAWTFRDLGAQPDLAVLERLAAHHPQLPGGLTEREVEVLQLVAAGRTNQQIAAELFLSHKTVARHLSNIFAKLDVASRSAATAFAFRHNLVRS